MGLLRKHNKMVIFFSVLFLILLNNRTYVMAKEINEEQTEYIDENSIDTIDHQSGFAHISKDRSVNKEITKEMNKLWRSKFVVKPVKEKKSNNGAVVPLVDVEEFKECLSLKVFDCLNESIANSALQLVGITNGMQCTEVATMALNMAGFSAGVHYPDQYYIYGYAVPASEARPGNLIFYNNGGRGIDHIAIYIGDGLAVHGNYNGCTVVESAYLPSAGAPQFIQIDF